MIFTKSSFPNRSGWITFFSHQYIPCYDMILTPKTGKFWGKFLDQGALFQFGTSIDGVDNCRHADSLAHICLSGSDHVRSRIQLGFPPFSFFGRPFWQQQVMQHVEGNDQGSREICRKSLNIGNHVWGTDASANGTNALWRSCNGEMEIGIFHFWDKSWPF